MPTSGTRRWVRRRVAGADSTYFLRPEDAPSPPASSTHMTGVSAIVDHLRGCIAAGRPSRSASRVRPARHGLIRPCRGYRSAPCSDGRIAPCDGATVAGESLEADRHDATEVGFFPRVNTA